MNARNIIPLSKYLLIEVITDEVSTDSGLVVSLQDKPNMAKVIAVGEDVNKVAGREEDQAAPELRSVPIEAGDTVIIIPDTGISVSKKENIELIAVGNVIGKIKGED